MSELEIRNALKRIEQKVDSVLRIEQKLDSVLTPSEKEYYTVKEVESILGISRSTFDRSCKGGVIETIRVGNRIRVHKSVVKHLLENGIKY